MWSDQLKTVAWVLAPSAILLLALNKAAFVYHSYVTRVLATVVVAASAMGVVATVKISNPSLAFMTGLLEGWMTIWSAVLLLRYNPPRDARRRRWRKAPKLDGEFEDCDQVWQRYPAHDWMCRVEWTTDLLLNFRGVGWKFDRHDETKDRKKPTRDARAEIENFEAPSLLAASLKIARDYLAFQAVLLVAEWMEQRMQPTWHLQALHIVTWLSSSILFITICYSSWALIGAIGQWATPPDLLGPFRIDQYNPSPWGPVGAVMEHGLAGLWGVTWHNYFKFGFQSASDMVIPRSSNRQLKAPLRLLRMVFSFLLSGVIHYCGSYMLPGPTQPGKEFLFFALQGVAVVFQVSVFDPLINKKIRRVLNPILIAGWLYWTEPLIFGDQKAGGMWRI